MSDLIYPAGDVTVAAAFADGQLVVEGTVVALADAAGISEEQVARATEVWISVSGGAVRFRMSGAGPTTDAGLRHSEFDGLLRIRGSKNVRRLRFIRDGASGSVTLDFELARVE